MYHYQQLLAREQSGNPIRIGVIGIGKFATMFLSQARLIPGMHIVALCDLDPSRAKQALRTTNWPEEQFNVASLSEAIAKRATLITEDVGILMSSDEIDVIIESTGDPIVGITHARQCIEHGKHLVMVNVEADVLVGPLLAKMARKVGVVYSLAYGDQPALIAEQIDWVRANGFEVVCAGKGTKYLPEYRTSTPDTIWDYYGLTSEQAAQGGMNPKMFNSFLDGTKSAIEMAAVANAANLKTPSDGLQFPPCSTQELAEKLKPRSDGGLLDSKGMVEVISSLERDGSEIERDLRWGVYVTFEAPTDYAARCFSEYGFLIDSSGRYAAMYRPSHLIGLELGVSVASAVLGGAPTGEPQAFNADVSAVAKRDLQVGEILDGEGGYSVWGKLHSATDSLQGQNVPIGLAQGVKLKNPIRAGEVLRWEDVEIDLNSSAYQFRKEREKAFRID